jgi:hypothetical protein
MQELFPKRTENVIPLAIRIDEEELKRLKAHKFIPLDLYIWWGLQLQFGSKKTNLDNDSISRFCEKWSFDYGEYIDGSSRTFNFTLQDVLIAIGKLAKKEGSGVKIGIQLSLDLGGTEE